MTQTVGTMLAVIGAATLAIAVLDWSWQTAVLGIPVLVLGVWFELHHNSRIENPQVRGGSE